MIDKWEEKLNNDIDKMNKNKNKRKVGIIAFFIILLIISLVFIIFILLTIGSPVLISILMEIDKWLGH